MRVDGVMHEGAAHHAVRRRVRAQRLVGAPLGARHDRRLGRSPHRGSRHDRRADGVGRRRRRRRRRSSGPRHRRRRRRRTGSRRAGPGRGRSRDLRIDAGEAHVAHRRAPGLVLHVPRGAHPDRLGHQVGGAFDAAGRTTLGIGSHGEPGRPREPVEADPQVELRSEHARPRGAEQDTDHVEVRPGVDRRGRASVGTGTRRQHPCAPYAQREGRGVGGSAQGRRAQRRAGRARRAGGRGGDDEAGGRRRGRGGGRTRGQDRRRARAQRAQQERHAAHKGGDGDRARRSAARAAPRGSDR